MCFAELRQMNWKCSSNNDNFSNSSFCVYTIVEVSGVKKQFAIKFICIKRTEKKAKENKFNLRT